MLFNYLLAATRNLLTNKIFSVINIAGLTMGISCCLLAALYLYEEYSFDRFHDQYERIWRVDFDNYQGDGPYATTPLPIGPALREEFPAVVAATRFQTMDNFLVRNGDNKYFEQVSVVDSGFLSVFSFKLLSGNPASALAGPNLVVLTEATAKKYFGQEDCVGKMLNIGSSGKLNSMVTGVVENPPGNSQLQFGFLLSFATLEKAGTPVNLWTQMPGNYTYVKLRDVRDAISLQNQFPLFAKKYLGDLLKGPYESNYQLALQPLADIHLRSHKGGELPTQGSETSIYLFASIAGIVLLIACINYVNLTTARYLRRAREIGVRKTAGASRTQLIVQLLGESLIIATGAGVLALALLDLLVPFFNEIANANLEFSRISPWQLMSAWILFVLVPALFAGIFPALYLANVNIIRALKGSLIIPRSGITFRRGLVVFQLFAATFLLTATLVIFRQMDFIRTSLYDHASNDQVMVFPINARLAKAFDGVQNQLSNDSHIVSVTSSSSIPGFNYDRWPVRTSLDGEVMDAENFVVDSKFIETMGYQLIAGRNFDDRIASDSAGFIINEKAVRSFGFNSAEQALGQTLFWSLDEPKRGTIIGVLKDFHFSTFREEIKPAMLQLNTYNWRQFAAVRIRMNDLSGAVNRVREAVRSIDENWYVDYRFMDANFENLHKRDLVQGKVFGSFAAIAIAISSLGLLGLVIFTTSQRTKEMGIRKTLGASPWGLMALVGSDFVRLFIIAFLVALPATWFAASSWLHGFAYRIELTADLFGITAISLLCAVFLTIGSQTIRLSRVNPSDVLRSE